MVHGLAPDIFHCGQCVVDDPAIEVFVRARIASEMRMRAVDIGRAYLDPQTVRFLTEYIEPVCVADIERH